jgi:primosomal protein N'
VATTYQAGAGLISVKKCGEKQPIVSACQRCSERLSKDTQDTGKEKINAVLS